MINAYRRDFTAYSTAVFQKITAAFEEFEKALDEIAATLITTTESMTILDAAIADAEYVRRKNPVLKYARTLQRGGKYHEVYRYPYYASIKERSVWRTQKFQNRNRNSGRRRQSNYRSNHRGYSRN